MRQNFAQIMSKRQISLDNEYKKLYAILYGVKEEGLWEEYSYYDILNSNFKYFWFKDTCLNLNEFNIQNGFNFEETPDNFNIDYLVNFAEYLYNLAKAYMRTSAQNKKKYTSFILNHIETLISLINYKKVEISDFTVFVPVNIYSIEVSNLNPDYAVETLYYNHKLLRGNIKGKKELLIKFAEYLESERKKLKSINTKLESDLFHMFNKLNIRHNNTNPNDSAHYVKYVDEMNVEDLEKWYDTVYQMYLLACLELEHSTKKIELNDLLSKLNNK